MRLRVLYICYLTLDDPLVHTQVVAYLDGLAARGHTIHLLTFEPRLSSQRQTELSAELRDRGITWHALRYHKRPSLPATIYDALAGAVVATRLVRRHRLDAIHARNHVPAVMALIARLLMRCRFIFDLRGLMADEYADAGIWRRGGVRYLLTEWVQRRALRRANGIVMLTDAVREQLARWLPRTVEPEVIPCCVDLERIDGGMAARDEARRDLGLDGRRVMVYVGKFTGWYMEREMVEFFGAAREREPRLLFLIVTQADSAPIEAELRRAGIDTADYRITSSKADELGRYLATADFGISFVRPSVSKISSSPTKVGEYLAAGLPTLSTVIGDLGSLLGDGRAGVLVREFSPEAYDAAAEQILRLAADPRTRETCRTLAQKELSLADVGIPRYDEVYRRVAGESAKTEAPTDARTTIGASV